MKSVLLLLTVCGASAISIDDDAIIAYFSLSPVNGSITDESALYTCVAPDVTPTQPPIQTPLNDPESAPFMTMDTGATAFDGDDYFVCPSSLTEDISASANRSICVWALVDEANDGGFFQYGEPSTCAHFGLRTATSVPVFDLGLRIQAWAACDVDAPFNASAYLNEWAYYCVTYDGTYSSLYVNWMLMAQAETPLNTGNGLSTDFFIGYNDIIAPKQLDSSFFVGSMSGLAIASKVLSVEEMIDLANVDMFMGDNSTNSSNVTMRF